MKNCKNTVLLTALGVVLTSSCTYHEVPLPAAPADPVDSIPKKSFCDSANVTYSNFVYPLVQSSCMFSGCHGAGSTHDYSTYEGLKAKIDNGSFNQRVLVDKSMPPASSPGPKSLTDDQLKKLKCWYDNGAPNN